MFEFGLLVHGNELTKVGIHGSPHANKRLPLQATAHSERLVGTLGSQPGNQRLPSQETGGPQSLELILMLPNLGTTSYHCKELLVPKA